MIRIRTNFDLSEDLDAIEKGILEGLDDVHDRMTERAADYLKKKGKRATGDLIDSIDGEIKRLLGGFRLEWGPNVTYWPFVDKNTKPHWPPIDPIKKWVRVKFGLTGREKTSVAWAVATKISKEGTEGVNFVDHVVRFIEPIAAQAIDAHVERRIG